MKNKSILSTIFWISLLLFFAWDWGQSKPINLLNELPALAAGSGQKAVGGHCSNVGKE